MATLLPDLRYFRGYTFLGNEDESQVKRDILRKVSRALKQQKGETMALFKSAKPVRRTRLPIRSAPEPTPTPTPT